MVNQTGARAPFLLSLLVAGAACVGVAQARTPSPAHVRVAADASPSLVIQSPAFGDTIRGVAIIRFLAGDVALTSPFATVTPRAPLVAAHLHVTVDGAPWHWVHASADPVVITPLSPGEHTVSLELAGADHRPLLETRTVRFTVVSRAVATTDHVAHQ